MHTETLKKLPWLFQWCSFRCLFAPVDVWLYNLLTVISSPEQFSSKPRKVVYVVGVWLVSLSSEDYLSVDLFQGVSVIGGPWAVFYVRGKKKENLDQLTVEEGYAWPAYWFPPFLTSLTPPVYPSIPLSLHNSLVMSSLPVDPPPAVVSQGSLRPSLALLGRRFLLRARATRHILLQPAKKREKCTVTRYEWNQIFLTCPAATSVFHTDRLYEDWVNGMQLLILTWQIYRTVRILQ